MTSTNIFIFKIRNFYVESVVDSRPVIKASCLAVQCTHLEDFRFKEVFPVDGVDLDIKLPNLDLTGARSSPPTYGSNNRNSAISVSLIDILYN